MIKSSLRHICSAWAHYVITFMCLVNIHNADISDKCSSIVINFCRKSNEARHYLVVPWSPYEICNLLICNLPGIVYPMMLYV